VSRALDMVALAVTASGVVVLALAVLVARWKDGLPAALELWVAAGLLRLAHAPEPKRLAAASAIIAVRHLVGFGLRTQRTLR